MDVFPVGYIKNGKSLLLVIRNQMKTKIYLSLEFKTEIAQLHGDITKKEFFDFETYEAVQKALADYDFRLTRKVDIYLKSLVELNEQRKYTDYLKTFCIKK